MVDVAMFAAGFVVAAALTPAGVSGAFLLVPFQVALLGAGSVAVTPTNLLFNVIATPGSILAYQRAGRLDMRLATLLSLGSLPGVALGAWLRVHLLADPERFRTVIGVVLLLLAGTLVADRRAPVADAPLRLQPGQRVLVAAAALVIGVVGGIYGVGGGAFMAPVLTLATGCSLRRVAGATLLCTLVTSVVGIASFAFVAGGPAPDWRHGALLGAGGLVGGYLGARLQPWVPERRLRLLLTGAIAGMGIRYLT